MKKIGFITRNKVLAQSLSSLIKNNLDLPFEPYVLLNFEQATIDVGILKIDIAIIEMIEEALSLCEELRKTDPECRILLLVPQDNKELCDLAMKAVRVKSIDDYVFLDTSLDYLLAKLLTL